MGNLRDEKAIEAMKKAGRLVALAHQAIREAVKPGVTSRDLDEIAERVITEGGGKPAFKGYHGFPSTICASVNEEVVHGIPNRRKLVEGDIISVDIGAIVDGHYGDSAWTYAVGTVAPEVARLLEVTEQSLYAAIDAAKPGNRVGDIGAAVEAVIAPEGYGIVRDFVGHGIGTSLHESPQIPNFKPDDPGPTLQAGDAIAIEPMINLGTHKVRVKGNGWTVVTQDGRWSAHFEHTIVIGEQAPLITTRL